jgi:hypothetical protein
MRGTRFGIIVLYWKARESLNEALRGCQGTSYARSRERYQWTIGSVQQLAVCEREGKASIRVKMADGRRQGLNGYILVEKAVYDGIEYSEVRFAKASGDPLEWRRFFKNVVVCIGDVVLRPD